MIKTISAYTLELDDLALGVSEILEQLAREPLRSHTVGLLSCYDEFIDNGTVKALSDALPFDLIGCSTLAAATAGEAGEMMLCLTVFTSDEVRFCAGVTSSLTEQPEAALTEAYQKARSLLPSDPALMLLCGPVITQMGGEILVERISAITGGIPLFGTLASHQQLDFSKSATIFNGQSRNDILSFILIHGPIRPAFFGATIPGEKIKSQRAIITKAQDNILMEINHLPVQTYLEHLGLMDAWVVTVSFPFLIDYHDGTKPMLRSIYTFTPEGYAVCGGQMPVGAAIMVGNIDYEDVVATTAQTLKELLRAPKPSCILLFSCLTRYLVLGTDSMAELELVRSSLGDRAYHLCYSKGEICPVYDDHGRLVNRFHNCTLIACVF
ncbi:MAG: FIST C-terminal domain-containing protein [Spirochaetaceae bacterium]|jgi:hypothetical protein|nr:FIST C-terminal domain-containing protein [Spirochaetaceae bacterium]